MLLGSEERRQIARLFNFLLQGEYLAYDCSMRQARLFPDLAARRFLLSQASQEAFHARLFRAGIGILAPRGIGEPAGKKVMARYRRLLDTALDRGDCGESVLGMQIILEGLGDITLKRISAGFPARGLAFHRLRQVVVGQEDAHHGFGLRQFQNYADSRSGTPAGWQYHAEDFLQLAGELVASVAPLFEYFEEDPRAYLDELMHMVPLKLTRSAA